jgi:hypothetical protein
VLTRNHRQEALCRAYVQAIAACCGMTTSTPQPDYGIDLSLHDVERRKGRHEESGHNIDVQAKSTSQAGVSDSVIRYDLDVRSYDLLRRTRPGTPRILVVLVLPEEETLWSTQTEGELVLRRCAYWRSLRGKGPTTNRRTVRVTIPRANVFSVTALRTLVKRIKTGERI